MDTNKMREGFIRAYRRLLITEGMKVQESRFEFRDGKFAHRETAIAWWAWQASREAVVVELPNRPYESEADQDQMTDYEIGIGHGGCEEWDKIRDKIKAQGLKVAP